MTLLLTANLNVFAATSGSADTQTIYVTTKSNWWVWGSPSITLTQEKATSFTTVTKYIWGGDWENETKYNTFYPMYFITAENLTTGDIETGGWLNNHDVWNTPHKTLKLKDDCNYRITVQYDYNGSHMSSPDRYSTPPYWYVSATNKATCY